MKIVVQDAVLMNSIEDIEKKKEQMKNELIERIKNLDPNDIIDVEDRANCKYLTIKTEINKLL